MISSTPSLLKSFSSDKTALCVDLILLGIFEEAVGTLHALEHDGGSLIARIGPVTVVLPAELEAELRPRIGQKLGIIRCADSARPYRIRVCG